MFTFNNDYDDFAQVAQFIGDFARVRDEILSAGQYPYNDSFVGRIPGEFNRAKRKNVEGDHETAAIYMLQGLFRAWAQEAEALDLLTKGYEIIDALEAVERFQHIVLHPTRRMGGERAEYHDARLLPERVTRSGDVIAVPTFVLPKGKRTRGYRISGRRVLALR